MSIKIASHADVARAFAFPVASEPLDSLSPHAPVYRLRHRGRTWVLKRTRTPLAAGRAVAAWTRALVARGVDVVTPAEEFAPNPRAFQGPRDDEETWVVYRWIGGDAYRGGTRQVHGAGDLLGRIHATCADQDYGLPVLETVVPITPDDCVRLATGALSRLHRVFPGLHTLARDVCDTRIRRYQHALTALLDLRLPLVNASWDYKGCNLVYIADDQPILIDPDSGGRIPRLYDLAVALLLFHNEVAAPHQLFTRAQWQAFLAAYTAHVRLTDAERHAWPDVLLAAWIDEGLWLASSDDEGWDDPMQAQMLASLMTTALSEFELDAAREA
jgi:Ser/Thr protein kinase RdoA (MazF antagonist)